MGGQSFKCPMCDKWYLVKGSLRDHIKAKHNLKNFHIVGTGSNVGINCDDPPNPTQG
jgi:hypothetical protein